jgi:HJR/Mrr/RecB family endonuclease
VLSRNRFELPWWSGLALGVLLYVLLKWIAPAAVVTLSPALSPAAAALRASAMLVALVPVICSLVWVLADIRKRSALDHEISLAALRALPREHFERFLAEAFRREGYVVMPSDHRDCGADLVLTRDNDKLLVQCRRWRGDVNEDAPLRELHACMSAAGASGCVMVITGQYGAEARAFTAGKPMRLITGRELERMLRTVDAAAGGACGARA